jgi:hypothetical protein
MSKLSAKEIVVGFGFDPHASLSSRDVIVPRQADTFIASKSTNTRFLGK